jgi:hypothetical protein
MFIWEPSHCENGNWNTIITKAKASGFTWLIMHNFYSQAVIQQLKAAGFYVAYSFYCTPSGGDGPIAGAAAAVKYGCDAILFDAETPWETDANGNPTWHGPEATQFITHLRSAIGDTYLANAGAWQRPQFHPKYPDKEFALVADAAMPEVYWTEYPPSTPYAKAISDSEDAWKTYPDVQGYKEVIRLGSAYGTNGTIPGGHSPLNEADLQDFITRYPTCALWSWMHVPQFGWDLFAKLAAAKNTPSV